MLTKKSWNPKGREKNDRSKNNKFDLIEIKAFVLQKSLLIGIIRELCGVRKANHKRLHAV